jgi:hypothetical protein
MKIYIWPNGEWCYKEALSDYLDYYSDDYSEMTVPDDTPQDQIEQEVQNLLNLDIL